MISIVVVDDKHGCGGIIIMVVVDDKHGFGG
jgi:hypothetical protein